MGLKKYCGELILEYFKFQTKPGCHELVAFSRNVAGFQTKGRKFVNRKFAVWPRLEDLRPLQNFLSAIANLSYSSRVEESNVMRIKINHLIA